MSKPKTNTTNATEVKVELTPEQLAAKELADKQAAEAEAKAKELEAAKLLEVEEQKKKDEEALLLKQKEEAELAELAKQAQLEAEALAKLDSKSAIVSAVEHEIEVYVKLHDTANVGINERIARHTALIRLTENVINLPKSEDFIGSMDAFLRAVKVGRGANGAFSAAVINRFASEVKVSTASAQAYQFFINALTVVAEHLDSESNTDFNKDITKESFEQYYPGMPGERFLGYCIRLCK